VRAADLAILPSLAGFGEAGWLSASSSASDTGDEFESPLASDPDLRSAVWDMLSRPAGMSLRRLRRQLEAARGSLPPRWMDAIVAAPHLFCVFVPRRRELPTFVPPRAGAVYCDTRRHPGAEQVRCFRPFPLGNPWPVGPQSIECAVSFCESLFASGGEAAALGGTLHPAYADDASDRRREAELRRLAHLVRMGASIHLRDAPSCERERRMGQCELSHVHAVAAAVRRLVASIQMSAPFLPRADAEQLRTQHVRRVIPAPPSLPPSPPLGAPRLQRALLDMDVSIHAPSDAVQVIVAAQPLALAGATNVRVPALEAPSAFSHRRLERRGDGECLATPFPVTNAPPVMPIEAPPPPDPSDDLMAESVEEVVPHGDLRLYRGWARRADRSIELARRGNLRHARSARPDDLVLARSQPRFQGVTMDFSVFPFRPLLPSRWPDRPPSTDLRIRHIRREFQAHPDYPDRQLRGFISHGNPEVGACSPVSFFAAPHASAYAHVAPWLRQVGAERDAGWAVAGFERSYGLATWPQRCQPTSMVERHGKWRLCHDMSWPPLEDPLGVDSPNAADAYVLVLVFLVVSQVCLVVAIYVAAGLPAQVAYFDLSKAYKRTAQQRATRWRRTFWSDQRSQTLDRVCFGQTDGPEVFSRQSSLMVFIMRRELAYADRCYPSRDDRVLAFIQARRTHVPSGEGCQLRGGTPSDSLAWVGAMIDDFALVAVDDLLFRADGTAVFGPENGGRQRTRSWLAFEVCSSVVARFGHLLEPGDLSKYHRPDSGMLYLGNHIDVVSEEMSFDSDGPECKRVRYVRTLRSTLASDGVSPAELTSLAFKMLVVCECDPFSRQWLSPIFRALRHQRTARIVFAQEPHVRVALQRFCDRLESSERLAVPLAARHSFPFADSEHLLVAMADASGPPRPGEVPDGVPGYGAWCVRHRVLYIVDGLWEPEELDVLSISVLEYVISFWATAIFADVAPRVTHLLEFSDNSGTEWSMRRETPSARLMQIVAARRSQFLRQRGLFSRVCRVASADNSWADCLSRQKRERVLREAAALGLRVVALPVPPSLRDTHWLTRA
jgi:hypothetical protein